MDLPRVNPVGQVEVPGGFRGRQRRYPRGLRTVAVLLLVIFAAVGIVTTSVSLGRYCLTTDGADSRELPRPSVPARSGGPVTRGR